MSRILASMFVALVIGAFAVNAQDAPKPEKPAEPAKPADDTKPADDPKPDIRTPTTVADAVDGKFKVATISDIKLHDEARKKDVALTVYAPEGEGKFPVILFSAGQGGGGQGMGQGGNQNANALPRYWASHGYVVILPTHVFAAPTAPTPEKKPEPGKKEEEFSIGGNAAGSVIDEPEPAPPPRQNRNNQQGQQFRPSAEAGIDRVKDFSLVLDNFEKLAENEALKGKLDKDKIAVAGAQFGSYAAVLAGGATVDVADKKAESFTDKRVKAVMELSPYGAGQLGLTKDSWKTVKLPTLTMTGTLDRLPTGQGQEPLGPDWRRDAFANAAEGGKVHVFIEGAGAGTFTGQRMGNRRQQPTEEQLAEQAKMFNWAKAATLHFWDSTLKADEAAGKALDAEAFKKATDGKVTVEKR